jgi:putative ABC transport system permease protein
MTIVRNVFRRKTRAFLTIFGITIGVLALVVMGAMAEKLQLLVDGGVSYYADKVMVTDAGTGGMFGAPMSLAKVREIERVPGVVRASASLGLLLDKDQGNSMGVPPMIMGTDFRADGYEKFEINYVEGRALRPGDEGKVTLGSDIARKLKAEVGRTVTLRGEKFVVVGIADKTLTAPDNTAMVTMSDAQHLFVQDLPATVASQVNVNDMCTSIAVYPKPDVDPEKLAKTVGLEVSGIKAAGPSTFKEQVGSQMKLFNAIVYSVAFISLLIGGMSVVNTMTMSVSERTREIGIRKAIGASHGAIMRQFVAESGLIGLVGGLTGLIIGTLITMALNQAGEASGTVLFLVTARLAIGSLVFALGLGALAGLYPAWHAARLSPVRALRFE